ncbi:hypothetical protein SH668x_001463 [Planctomicrobium sp. SH668]|uniref:hypothetical protein n=1 Tax=Planctomicrobium sp. SH668 TaxID=3448126 RepID=UPI003F5C258F
MSHFHFRNCVKASLRLIAATVLAIGTASLGGCGLNSGSGDATAARLSEMGGYTMDVLVSEVSGRIKESKRRSNERKPAAGGGEDRTSSNGPGGNPFAMDRIASDVAEKLKSVPDGTSEAGVSQLIGKLKEAKVDGALLTEFEVELKKKISSTPAK